MKSLPSITAVFIGLSLFIICASSCSNKKGNELVLFESLNEGLKNSNNTISTQTADFLMELKEKTYDPSTKEHAVVWYSKAMQIKDISDSMYDYISTLAGQLKSNITSIKSDKSDFSMDDNKDAVEAFFVTNNKSNELFSRLKKYKEDLLNIDSNMNVQFRGKLIITTQAFDSQKNNEKDFTNTFFVDTRLVTALALLNKFQNNILIAENQMVEYCFYNVGHTDGEGFFTKLYTIATLSSSFVKAGDEIVLTAGIGSFNDKSSPVFTINNKRVPLNEDGVAIYKSKASKIPGKHFIKLDVEFLKPDGTKTLLTKKMEYTVATDSAIIKY
jgi:hypothetical protein